MKDEDEGSASNANLGRSFQGNEKNGGLFKSIFGAVKNHR